MWLPLTYPHLGTWPTTQACALTRNRTGNPLVQRPALSPLSYTSQGSVCLLTTPNTAHGRVDPAWGGDWALSVNTLSSSEVGVGGG